MARMDGETWRIIECTKPSEFNDLTDKQKDWYRIIISAVTVNLDEGSRAYKHLWEMFPEDTVTGAALRDPTNGLTPLSPTPNP